MIQVRRQDEIYHKEGGWFSANWHFSFDEYYDIQNMGFGALRVFNDDTLRPGVARRQHTAVTLAVAVLKRTLHHVRQAFDIAVRVHGPGYARA